MTPPSQHPPAPYNYAYAQPPPTASPVAQLLPSAPLSSQPPPATAHSGLSSGGVGESGRSERGKTSRREEGHRRSGGSRGSNRHRGGGGEVNVSTNTSKNVKLNRRAGSKGGGGDVNFSTNTSTDVGLKPARRITSRGQCFFKYFNKCKIEQ